MKILKTTLTIGSLVSICLTSRAITPITVLDSIPNPANGHDYYLLSSASWTDSEAYAKTLGGDLTTINDFAEDQWVFNNFTPLVSAGACLWIGLSDPSQDTGGGTHASNFVWANGETPGYTDWDTVDGEPNNTGGTEFYAAIRPAGYTPPGSWNDFPDTGGGNVGNIFGVVEVVPEPQSTVLIALAAGTFIAIRRKKL